FFASRLLIMWLVTSVLLFAILATTSWIFSLYGTYAFAFCSALLIFDADTISIAFVIFFVFVVELIRPSISLSDAKLFTTLSTKEVVQKSPNDKSASLRWLSLLASYLDLFDHALKGCLQSIYHAYHGFNTSAVFIYSAGKKVFLNDSIASFISSASGSCPVSRIDASNSLRFVSSHTWNSSSKRTISETAMSSKKPFVKA